MLSITSCLISTIIPRFLEKIPIFFVKRRDNVSHFQVFDCVEIRLEEVVQLIIQCNIFPNLSRYLIFIYFNNFIQ